MSLTGFGALAAAFCFPPADFRGLGRRRRLDDRSRRRRTGRLRRLRLVELPLALGFRDRHEALDVLRADEVGQERHEFERLRKRGIAAREARLHDVLEVGEALAREVYDPLGRALVIGPGLHQPVLVLGQVGIARVQVEALLPFLQELQHAFVGGRHGQST